MKKYKIGLIIIVVFLVIGLASFAYLKTKQVPSEELKNSDCDTSTSQTCSVDLKSATTIQTTKTTVGSFGDTQKIDQNIYSSQKLKFKLDFTPIWAEAKVVETIPFETAVGKVEFKLPTTDSSFPDKLAPALTIYVYKVGEGPKDNTMLNKITQSDVYEYYFTSWQLEPSDLGMITEKEIARVANTLEVIK
jgi:hypothetical protein